MRMSIAVCELCALAHFAILWGGAGYVVFGLGHSGWWFLLPLCLSGWNCKYITQNAGSAGERTDG